MGEFEAEVTVLSRWLGRDVTTDPAGVIPAWTVFRFRDAAVFALDLPDGTQRLYLVRGDAVGAFVMSEVSIDEAYASLGSGGPLPAAA